MQQNNVQNSAILSQKNEENNLLLARKRLLSSYSNRVYHKSITVNYCRIIYNVLLKYPACLLLPPVQLGVDPTFGLLELTK